MLNPFAEKYSDIFDFFKQDAQATYSLSPSKVDNVYAQLKDNPMQRAIGSYTIVGEMPIGDGFNDNFFYIEQARAHVLIAARSYIDENHGQVYSQCVGLGLPSTTSNAIWHPGCCDVQLHRSCFKQCQYNQITHCINPFCQKDEFNRFYASKWTPEFYAAVLKKEPVLKGKRVRPIDCPVCMEPLQEKIELASLPIIVKRRKLAAEATLSK